MKSKYFKVVLGDWFIFIYNPLVIENWVSEHGVYTDGIRTRVGFIAIWYCESEK